MRRKVQVHISKDNCFHPFILDFPEISLAIVLGYETAGHLCFLMKALHTVFTGSNRGILFKRYLTSELDVLNSFKNVAKTACNVLSLCNLQSSVNLLSATEVEATLKLLAPNRRGDNRYGFSKRRVFRN